MKKDMSRNCLIMLLLILLVMSGCVQRPSATPIPPPTPPLDATAPPAITDLVATDAYDGKVNLRWQRSAATDFGHYNLYVSNAETADVTGMTPIHQIRDIAVNTYQVTGLGIGTKHYLAVTATDKSGNENKRVASISVTPTLMPRGTLDPDIQVNVYRSELAWPGTTLLPDNHNREKPRIIEVNMLGEVIWEYLVPTNLRQHTNPGFDTSLLPNNNILFVLPRYGIYEIDRNGKLVWSYLTEKISHDADRLLNGNTIFVFGADDRKEDAQVTEVNPKGEIIWTWYAKGYFNTSPYKDIYNQGWTHANAVIRLPNCNTLLSLRNFNLLVEVDPNGAVVKTIGEGIVNSPHDPEVLPNGNILVASQWRDRPHKAMEIDPKTGKVVWEFAMPDHRTWPIRDANRLPNGNTLITGSTEVVEVTPEGEIVWQLRLKGVAFRLEEASGLGFYKAERNSIRK